MFQTFSPSTCAGQKANLAFTDSLSMGPKRSSSPDILIRPWMSSLSESDSNPKSEGYQPNLKWSCKIPLTLIVLALLSICVSGSMDYQSNTGNLPPKPATGKSLLWRFMRPGGNSGREGNDKLHNGWTCASIAMYVLFFTGLLSLILFSVPHWLGDKYASNIDSTVYVVTSWIGALSLVTSCAIFGSAWAVSKYHKYYVPASVSGKVSVEPMEITAETAGNYMIRWVVILLLVLLLFFAMAAGSGRASNSTLVGMILTLGTSVLGAMTVVLAIQCFGYYRWRLKPLHDAEREAKREAERKADMRDRKIMDKRFPDAASCDGEQKAFSSVDASPSGDQKDYIFGQWIQSHITLEDRRRLVVLENLLDAIAEERKRR